MALNAELVRETFARMESNAEAAGHGEPVAYFYGRLFAEHPRLRALFPPAMDVQRDRLYTALTTLVRGLDDPDTLSDHLARLGRDHRKFGVQAEHYAAVGGALLATVRRYLGEEWNPRVEDAWRSAYELASRVMLEAADEHSAWAPPWWQGEVVALDRPTDSVARLAVRPNQSYPFLPGQYLTLQTARWPQVWRPYSIANTPQSDDLLRLVVRAVPGGWVSNALVRHTRVGDVLLLGPPQGAMVLDAASRRGLVCVAGGTGIAPVKAIVEQVAGLAQRRSVLLLYGARTSAELTELGVLRTVQATYPWLRVVCVVEDTGAEPPVPGEPFPGTGTIDTTTEPVRGRLPDVIGDFGPFDDHDAFVCGPTDMVRATIPALCDAGVRRDRIRHDLTGAEALAATEAAAGHTDPPQDDSPVRGSARHRAPRPDLIER